MHALAIDDLQKQLSFFDVLENYHPSASRHVAPFQGERRG
jgi:hypothetical protein